MNSTLKIVSIRILIVEDHGPTATTILQMLSQCGLVRNEVATDIAAAVKLLKTARFDLMLCDVRLADGNGLTLVKEIRHNRDFTNRYMPIIVMSSDSGTGVVDTALQLGANHFLAKPISPESLAGVIRDVVMHPKAFVTAGHYFGPDRRRRQEAGSIGRRAADRPSVRQKFGEPWR